ncbi:maltose ABC transporter permease MalG [Actimicrobium sp. CCC2.4]|uniref:maltose ABC transporter permease MalG n=1 Tax=Actimicrobium sp. CCC2.4 TaxID=3048606 RepID=UPI002AC9B748|nr:maltose ABC transporter permease MalG [Actimicrobium sp. CCC2.4]MEB0137200.1 maltose ABC transporter permease MalG [Actimicrobium sp. CCC2.4]WPX32497.1 maltose ABC transporter permease MalG [Actimicrobium sp. CCC2.4]
MAVVTDRSNRWRVVLAHLAVITLICLVLFPFLMILSISLRPGNFASGSLIPTEISLDHWRLALGMSYQGPNGVLVEPDFPVLRWLWNSVKIATMTATITLLLSTTCAYAFARMKFKFKSTALAGLLLLQMFPAVLALIAIYTIFDMIGTYVPWLGIDSHGSLVLAYTGGIAMHIWTIKGYYDTIPVEIEEAAKVDGATPWQAFLYVLLPMAVPILMVVFLLAFIGAIIEYPVASVLLHEQNNLTLAVGSKLFLYEQKYLWGDFAAAAILSGLPITVVFLLAQKWMISGLTAGGVKG